MMDEQGEVVEDYVDNSPMVIPQGSIAIEKQMPPSEQMAMAQERAAILMKAVDDAGLAYNLGGNKAHLGVEAWQILGKFDNATPRLVYTKRLTINGEENFYGYEAKVEVVKNGQVIASADAMCTRDEDNWNMRGTKLVPEFQLRSMAQTRATSKALRMAYGWIAVLAGYSATPAEEMVGNENDDKPDFMKQPAKTVKKAATKTKAAGDKVCKVCGATLVHSQRGNYSGFFCPDAPYGDKTHTAVWDKK